MNLVNLVKHLATIALKYEFYFECVPIHGDVNPIADALSRKNDLLRNYYYNKFNKSYFIPLKNASNIITYTCCDKFCNPVNF